MFFDETAELVGFRAWSKVVVEEEKEFAIERTEFGRIALAEVAGEEDAVFEKWRVVEGAEALGDFLEEKVA